MHRFKNNFHDWLRDEQLCRWKLFIGTTMEQSFIIWKWKIKFCACFQVFDPPKLGGRGYAGLLILFSLETHTRFPNTCTLKSFWYLIWFSHKSTEYNGKRDNRRGRFGTKYIGQCNVTSKSYLQPIKLDELTFQMSQERKLCDRRCAFITSGWFAWHTYYHHKCAHLSQIVSV